MKPSISWVSLWKSGFHVHTPNDSKNKNKFLTPRQLVCLCRIYKTDNTPPFIYVASNLGKLSGFCVGKNLRLSSMNEKRTKKPNLTICKVTKRTHHSACKARRGQQTPFSGVVRQVGLYFKKLQPQPIFSACFVSKKHISLFKYKGTNFLIKVPNKIENIFKEFLFF